MERDRGSIRPSYFHGVDMVGASQAEMDCVGVLGSMGIARDNLAESAPACTMKRGLNADG